LQRKKIEIKISRFDHARMEKAAKLEALIANWVTPPERTADVTKRHDEHIKDLIELCVYLKSENDRKEKRIASLESRLNGILEHEKQKPVASFSDVVKRKGQITTDEAFLLAGVAREQNDKERRLGNVVISGLPESNDSDATKREEHDRKSVEELVEFLQVEKKYVRKVRRVKSVRTATENANSRPTIVIAYIDMYAESVIKKARTLKQSERFKDVYVREDRTLAERIVDKKLRDECKAKNGVLESTFTVNGVQRKCGVENGKHFYYVVRDSTIKRFYIKDQ